MIQRVSYRAAALLIGAIVAAGSIAYGSEYDTGKALYEEKCSICHGADGKGDGPAASALSPAPKDFNTPAFWQQKNVGQIITKTVQDGKGPMPPFELNKDETGAIINFMSHSFKK